MKMGNRSRGPGSRSIRFLRPILIGILAAIPLQAYSATVAEAPRVRIDGPRGGWTSKRVVLISGTLDDRKLRKLTILLNGVSRQINAYNGRFDAQLPVRSGLNTVEAIAQSSAGAGRDRTTIFASVPPTDLQILLTWDTAGTDLDLHVTEPSGEQCYHGNRQTAPGGTLEVDDTDGFGPEIYMLSRAPVGEYRIAVAYYDSGRARQTEAMVEVIIREGTPYERRLRFPITLTQEGQMLEVGTFLLVKPLE